MPSKSTTSQTQNQGPAKEELEAIERYLAQKPNFHELAHTDSPKPSPKLSSYELKVRQAVQEQIQARKKQQEAKSVIMPVLPKDTTASNLTDAVQGKGKEASTQGEKPLATADHHKAQPGPVINQDIGKPASKEELKKRAEELNK